jgi:peptidoglycan hydrolase-like protein with peptidoglycan-binding domain
MKLLRAAIVTVLAAAIAVTTAYGVGYAVRDADASASTPTAPSGPGPSKPPAQPVVPAKPIHHAPPAEPTMQPGPTILEADDNGDAVRDLQARLVQIEWLYGDVTGTYDAATVEAVRGFQAKREIPVTGEVDQRTLDRLHAMTSTPTHEAKHNIEAELGALDPRCKTGRALCVDKSTNSLRWVVDGRVLETFEVRFGSAELPTREGAFTVYRKSRDHVSSLYNTSMPFAMFFSGGQAVHYSPDFAAVGYNGASHGCVNVRDYDGIAALYDQVQLGDKVIVYWS